MYKLFLAVAVSSICYAAAIPLQIKEGISLVAITYTPPDSNPCTIALLDKSGLVPSVNDVNATLFTGADTDTTRTSANSFTWPTLTSGGRRTIFIGADPRGSSRLALDGKYYTIGLQNATTHALTLTCASGSSVTNAQFTTRNIPLGNYYPEPPQTSLTAPFGQVVLPTFQWDRTTPYIGDNGVLMRQVSLPMDWPEYTTRTGFGYVLDINSTWTTPNLADTNQNAATLATSAATNNPLFLAWTSGTPTPNILNWDASTGPWPTDLQVVLYGNGNATIQICISIDSGQTCASNPVTFNSFTGSNVVYNRPTSFPSNYFKSWGTNTKTLGAYELVNQQVGSVSTSGNTVTFLGPTTAIGIPAMNLRRPAGSKFKIAGCATAGTYTYASVDSDIKLTAVETIGTGAGCTYFDLSAGIRIVQTTAGTVNLSATYVFALSWPALAYQNPNYNVAGLTKVTDIAKDCDGVTQSPNLSGYLAQVGNINGKRGGIYLMQDNGRVCLQSVMFAPGVDYLTTFPGGAWDPANNKSIAAHNGNTLYTITKSPTDHDYTEYIPGTTVPPNADLWTYTAHVPATPLFDTNAANPSQLKTLCGPGGTNEANCRSIFDHYVTGQWQAPNIAAAIGGYTVWNTAPNNPAGESYFMKFRTNYNGDLVQAFDTFSKYPYRWNQQHSAPQGIDNIVFETSSVAVAMKSGLSGPHVLKFTSYHKLSGFVATTLGVSTCTNANPLVCTVPTEHKLSQYIVANNGGTGRGKGSLVTITGAAGGWSSLNGEWLAVAVGNSGGAVGSATTFNLYGPTTGALVDSSSFGAYPGGLTFTVTPYIRNFNIFSQSGNNPPTLILNQLILGVEPYTPDHLWVNGDAVGIASYPTVQFYVKRVNATQVQLYLDSALTVPVDTAVYPNFQGYGIYDAETCPNGLPSIYFDAAGTNNQVRCIKVNIAGEPCSYLATAGEAAAYPCALDPSSTGKVQLQTLAVGDAIGDVGLGQFTENMHIAAKSGLTLTLVRFTGGFSDGSVFGDVTPRMPSEKPTQGIHETGWMPFMLGSYNNIDNNPSTAYVNVTDPTNTPCLVTPVMTDHTDFGYWSGGLFAYSGGNGFSGAQEDAFLGVTIGSICGRLARRTHTYPRFLNYVGRDTYGYTASRQLTGTWITDWFNTIGNGGGDGNGQGSPFINAGAGHTFTLAAGTSHVYKVGRATAEVFSPKLVPMYAISAPTVLVDKSGPGSLITDSDIGKFCTAYATDECRTGSSAGAVFLALIADVGTVSPFNFSCSNNTLNIATGCAYQLGGLNGMMLQQRVEPFDIAAKYYRGVTRGFMPQAWPYSFQHMTTTPDGKWGFFVSTALNGAGQQALVAKLPDFPGPDSYDRSHYIKIPINIGPGVAGDSIRIAFGYTENGSTTNFYCTSRAEACYTSDSTTDLNPFVFSGETQVRTTCVTACTVNIPAISGRILYYQIYRYNSGMETTDGILRWSLVP